MGPPGVPLRGRGGVKGRRRNEGLADHKYYACMRGGWRASKKKGIWGICKKRRLRAVPGKTRDTPKPRRSRREEKGGKASAVQPEERPRIFLPFQGWQRLSRETKKRNVGRGIPAGKFANQLRRRFPSREL